MKPRAAPSLGTYDHFDAVRFSSTRLTARPPAVEGAHVSTTRDEYSLVAAVDAHRRWGRRAPRGSALHCRTLRPSSAARRTRASCPPPRKADQRPRVRSPSFESLAPPDPSAGQEAQEVRHRALTAAQPLGQVRWSAVFPDHRGRPRPRPGSSLLPLQVFRPATGSPPRCRRLTTTRPPPPRHPSARQARSPRSAHSRRAGAPSRRQQPSRSMTPRARQWTPLESAGRLIPDGETCLAPARSSARRYCPSASPQEKIPHYICGEERRNAFDDHFCVTGTSR